MKTRPLFSKKQSKIAKKYFEIAQEYVEMNKMSEIDAAKSFGNKEKHTRTKK